MTAPAFRLATFFDERRAWSLKTFGPADRHLGLIAHIRKELLEIEAKPSDLEEWIDVALLAMDGAWRSAGADGESFVAALVAKAEKNAARRWPDWRTIAPNEVSEHFKGLGADGERDPHNICLWFKNGRPGGICESDGHYLCHECVERMPSEDK